MSADANSVLRGGLRQGTILTNTSQVVRKYQNQSIVPTHGITSTAPANNFANHFPNAANTAIFPSQANSLQNGQQLIPQYQQNTSTSIALVHKVQHQVELTLTDQVTPLRLAGHLSVIAVAAIILLFSQVNLAEWNDLLPTSFLSGNMLGGSNTAESDGNQTVAVAATSNYGNSLANLYKAAVPFTLFGQAEAEVEPAPAQPVQEAPKVITLERIETYSVQSGDTVLGIAEGFGLQPETIQWANSKLERNPDLLSIGDQLIIPPTDGVLHIVKPGDTLTSLSTRYKTSAEDIVNYKLNSLADLSSTLSIGDQIMIPGGVKQPSANQDFVYNDVPSIASGAGAIKGTGAFGWPTAGSINQRYWSGHPAVDIGAWTGAPVKAADGGYVVLARGGWNGGYGKHVIIDHGNGYTTLYAHLNSIFVNPGENVERGTQIGTVGNTGNSTGPHLHFEIRYNGGAHDPFGYLR